MKRRILAVFAIIIVLASAACADVLKDFEVPLTEQAFSRCENGIRESSESCDLGSKTIPPGEDLCPEMGKILGIVQVCRHEECACIIDRMDCGNGIREGAEWCDPGDKSKEDPEKNDVCQKLSGLLGRNMTCNSDTCLCKATTDLAETAVCGDGKIEFKEQCEEDSDCGDGKECKDCRCLNKIPGINQTELSELLNQSDIPTPEEKKEIEMKEKKEFDYHDLTGAKIPEFFYSDFRKAYVNVYVNKGDSDYIIGVRTKYNIVQEIVDGGFEEPTRDVFVSEDDARAIIDSTDRQEALKSALEEGKIRYNAKGIFSRVWMWLKGLFR